MNLHSGEAGMYRNPMPPGRDNLPLTHQRRIAQIYHLSERELANESVEVRQLCRDYRDKLWASEKQAKIERGDMLVEEQARLEYLLDRCFYPNDHPDHGIFLCAGRDVVPEGGVTLNLEQDRAVLRAAIDKRRKGQA